MAILKVKKPFLFAHRGCVVVSYSEGDEIETDDADLIETATSEKWATQVKEKAKTDAPENKAQPAAPDNKAVGGPVDPPATA
jgi:hypothetical protein